jgi:hypothetical protein
VNSKCSDGLSVLLANIARIHTNIRYADAKAGVVLLVNMSILTAIYKLFGEEFPLYLENGDVNTFLLASIALLLLGASLCLLVTRPRGDEYAKGRGPGLVDPVRIAQHEKSDEYIKEITGAESNLIYQQAYELIWDVSKIDRAKYRMLSYALVVSFIGWVLSMLTIALHIIEVGSYG